MKPVRGYLVYEREECYKHCFFCVLPFSLRRSLYHTSTIHKPLEPVNDPFSSSACLLCYVFCKNVYVYIERERRPRHRVPVLMCKLFSRSFWSLWLFFLLNNRFIRLSCVKDIFEEEKKKLITSTIGIIPTRFNVTSCRYTEAFYAPSSSAVKCDRIGWRNLGRFWRTGEAFFFLKFFSRGDNNLGWGNR